MGIDSPQKRPGSTFIRESGGSDKGSPQNDPLSGEGKDSQTSTHYPFANENVKNRTDGQIVEGQNLRGYVFGEEGGPTGGSTKDATVAPDGTRRVKDLG